MGLIAKPTPPPEIPGPDAAEIDLNALTERTVEGLEGTGFRILIDAAPLREIHTHGRSITDKEICGVMVGNVWRDANGPYLHVTAVVRGEYASHQSAQVTFTSDTWTHINQAMDQKYPDDRIVGWYHTHPGFGVFLSDMDLFIQRSFFDMPWQIALVFDPIRDEEAVFSWKKGACDSSPYIISAEDPADIQKYAEEEALAANRGDTSTDKKRDGSKMLRVLRKYTRRSFLRMHWD